MSIQRWTHYDNRCDHDATGEWVTYADHVAEMEKRVKAALEAGHDFGVQDEKERGRAAVAEAEQRGMREALTGTGVAIYEQGQRDVFAIHTEWTVTGMCKPDCLPCRRLDELYAERMAGAKETEERIRKAVEGLNPSYAPFSDQKWLVRSAVLAVIDGLPAEQDHQQDDDEQDRVDDQQNVVIHTPESHRSGEKGSP
jgi:hypothetical protein